MRHRPLLYRDQYKIIPKKTVMSCHYRSQIVNETAKHFLRILHFHKLNTEDVKSVRKLFVGVLEKVQKPIELHCCLPLKTALK